MFSHGFGKRKKKCYNLLSCFNSPGENKDVETSDIYRYRESEKKAIEIGKIERLLKQISIDCHLNKSGNVYLKSTLDTRVPIITSQMNKSYIQLGDTEYSRICDFQKECEYNCIPDKDTNQLKNQTTIPSEIEINQPNLTNVMRLLNKLYETDIIFDFNDIYEYIVQSLINRQILFISLTLDQNNK